MIPTDAKKSLPAPVLIRLNRQLGLTQHNHKFQLTLAFTAAVISSQDEQIEDLWWRIQHLIKPSFFKNKSVQVSAIFANRTLSLLTNLNLKLLDLVCNK